MNKISFKAILAVMLPITVAGCGTTHKMKFADYTEAYKLADYCKAADRALDKSDVCQMSAEDIKPDKFNIDEKEYLQLVEILYKRLKILRDEYKKIELGETWSNITISIENSNFKIQFKYDDLKNSEYSSYDRHIIWRYEYLGIGMEQLNKEEREILKRYLTGAKSFVREETYESGIYIRDIKNIIDYDTSENSEFEEKTETANKKVEKHEEYRTMKNQILSFLDEEKDKS